MADFGGLGRAAASVRLHRRISNTPASPCFAALSSPRQIGHLFLESPFADAGGFAAGPIERRRGQLAVQFFWTACGFSSGDVLEDPIDLGEGFADRAMEDEFGGWILVCFIPVDDHEPCAGAGCEAWQGGGRLDDE